MGEGHHSEAKTAMKTMSTRAMKAKKAKTALKTMSKKAMQAMKAKKVDPLGPIDLRHDSPKRPIAPMALRTQRLHQANNPKKMMKKAMEKITKVCSLAVCCDVSADVGG